MRRLLCIAALVAATCLIPALAFAEPGDLDRSFSKDGRASIDFGGDEFASDVVVDRRGRSILVGTGTGSRRDFWVSRLRPDGRPDRSFSGDGRLRIEFPNGADAESVTLQPDGRIVVAGRTGTYNSDASPQYSYAMAAVRLEPNGRVDESFGKRGRRTVSIAANAGADDVAVDARGRILLAGYSGSRLAVARLDRRGDLDRSFGTGGRVDGRDLEPSIPGADALALDDEGRIVVLASGGSSEGTLSDFFFARLGSSGTLDTSFADGGVRRVAVAPGRTYDFASDLVLSAKGEIYGVGSAQPETTGREVSDVAIAKLTADGTPDPGFSDDGRLVIEAGKITSDGVGALARGGGLLVSADAEDRDAGADVAKVMAVGASGELDSRFGRGGVTRVRARDAGRETFAGGMARVRGKLLLSGAVEKRGGDFDFLLARLKLR